jgi:chain length determinant protein (polysaccharide antigen chain regulator)
MTDNRNENVIDLEKVFLALWLRKWTFAGVVLATVCLGVLLAFALPDLYRVSAVVEPGIIDVNPDGKYVNVDTVQNMKAKVDSNIYNQRLRGIFGNGQVEFRFKIAADIPKNANVLTIYTETKKEDIGNAIHLIDKVIGELQKDYSTVIDRKKSDNAMQKIIKESEINELQVKKKNLDTLIAQVRNEIKEYQEQRTANLDSLVTLKTREKLLIKEIANSKKNSDKLVQGRDTFLQNHTGSRDPDLASILYTTTIQQNISLSNELQKQSNELLKQADEMKGMDISMQTQIEERRIKITQLELQKNEQLDMQIAQKKIEIKDLEKRSSYIQDIHILGSPSASLGPVKPKRLMIIGISLLIGCFLGIMVSLLADYAKRPRVS